MMKIRMSSVFNPTAVIPPPGVAVVFDGCVEMQSGSVVRLWSLGQEVNVEKGCF